MAVDGNQHTGAIRDQRRAAGLSQQGLAERAKCSVSMVKLLERGYQPENGSRVLERIGAILGPTTNEAPAVTPGLRESSGRQARHGSA